MLSTVSYTVIEILDTFKEVFCRTNAEKYVLATL